MNNQQFAAALHEGKRVYGTCVVSPSPLWPGYLAETGLDFVFIDTEHQPLDRQTLCAMCQSYSAHGIAPLVRILSPDPYLASQAMDAGACGIVAPYIETPQQVQALYAATKLRPLKGQMAADIAGGAKTLSGELAAYVTDYNAHNLLVVNIESVPAICNLEAILALGQVDCLLLGPHDLSCSLGIPEQYEHPLFVQHVQEILAKAAAHSVPVGIHYAWGTAQEIFWGEQGVRLFIHSSDIMLLCDELTAYRSAMQAHFPENGS